MTVKGETFVFQSNRKYQDNKEKRHSLSDIDIENFSQIFPNLDIDKQLMKFKYDLKLNKKEYNNYPNAFWDWCHTNWTKHVNDSISINDINYNKDPIGIELGYNKIEFHNSSSKPVKLSDFKLVSNSDASASEFKSFKTNTWNPIFWQFIFMGICIWVIVNGVKGGIEKWSKIMMPAILVILIILMIRGLTLPKGSEALDFLFKPKFADLTPSSIVLALGHAFFTLSLGMGTMITYGSYLRSDQNLLSSALWIILLDTGIAIMAGVAIFATVFAMGADPGSGPGLIFEVLPTIFPKITGGAIWGTLFFFLLFLAALTSAISILEVVTAYFIDQKGWSRAKATSIFGIVITTVGIFCSLSMGGFTDFTTIFDLSFFDFMDYLSTKYMLPIGGMLTAIFIIYKWGVNQFMDEFKSGMNKMIISKNLITILLGIAASIVGFIILIEIFDVLFGIKLIQ
ncbi:MAG: sodium-dependent transporter [Candidatus Marinimicrobia bacterium]|nr:sodium-dependent transporter [Candidatus Neomarinimicrobiota bacterium]